MSLAGILLVAAVGCGAGSATAAVLIARELDRRGLRTPLPRLGSMVFRNLDRYRRLTLEQTGRVGPLYYLYLVPIWTGLVLMLLSLAAYDW